MEITYLGHSSFKIKAKTASLVTDPYDPSIGLKFPKVSADVVTVSHEHDDHNKTEHVKDARKIVKGPGEYEIAGISIIGIPSFHDAKKGEERGKNTIYIIETEGLRLVHLGDLGHKLDQGQIEDLGEVDVLMIPVGGQYTVGPAEAVEISRAVEPKIVIPMHYKIPALNEEVFGKLETAEAFLNELALPTENSDKLILKGVITEEQKAVVLKPING